MDPGGASPVRLRRRIPRARGDGPRPVRPNVWRKSDSPRSRGWTLQVLQVHVRRAGFPALAGMDLPQVGRYRVLRRIPRARGDGPQRKRGTVRKSVDSPRSRGWTETEAAEKEYAKGFPALAGMDPWSRAMASVFDRIPRARGDGPSVSTAGGRRGGDSPRSRGWTVRGACSPATSTGFPALAGMDPNIGSFGLFGPRIPRARGDGPIAAAASGTGAKDSPRSRGWTLGAEDLLGDGDGFPALAGMDPARRSHRPPPAGIPRARGDGPRRGVDRWG